MKKLLLGTAAIALAATFSASPANAQVKLDVGGHFKGYVGWLDQDDNLSNALLNGNEARNVDIIRETELHFSGETTLDNGLTVGVHVESDIDGTDKNIDEESYAYFSGAWGRVNFGKEDGAAYLLQVAAPSADSNIDGIRQYVQPVNYGSLLNSLGAGGANNGAGTLLAGTLGAANTGVEVSYDQDISGFSNKLTYMTPVFNGFQVGASYTPSMGNASRDLNGFNLDNRQAGFGDVLDVAARYEGQFDQLGVTFGGGFTTANLEKKPAVGAGVVTDDRQAWNIGLDLNWGAFGLGGIYTQDDHGNVKNANNVGTADDEQIFVIGADYTTGPFKLGASYYNGDNSFGVDQLQTDRYTGGVTYTYGPGMTFRGSVSYIKHDDINKVTGLGGSVDGNGNALNDANATSILLGTQINF